jgi:hypothetical protein
MDAIIEVGYHVNSKETTQCRIWATNILRELMIKSFVLDDGAIETGQTVWLGLF